MTRAVALQLVAGSISGRDAIDERLTGGNVCEWERDTDIEHENCLVNWVVCRDCQFEVEVKSNFRTPSKVPSVIRGRFT